MRPPWPPSPGADPPVLESPRLRFRRPTDGPGFVAVRDGVTAVAPVGDFAASVLVWALVMRGHVDGTLEDWVRGRLAAAAARSADPALARAVHDASRLTHELQAALQEARLVPLADGRVVLVTGDGVSFFDL